MIKANEVRMHLKDKVHPQLLDALVAIVEELAVKKQQILELSMLLNRCIDTCQMMVEVNGKMRQVMEENGFDMEAFKKLDAKTAVENKDSIVNSEDMKKKIN